SRPTTPHVINRYLRYLFMIRDPTPNYFSVHHLPYPLTDTAKLHICAKPIDTILNPPGLRYKAFSSTYSNPTGTLTGATGTVLYWHDEYGPYLRILVSLYNKNRFYSRIKNKNHECRTMECHGT